MADNWSFLRLVAGFLLVFASVLGFVATVEHDQHCKITGTESENPGGYAVEYSQLNSEQQQVFDQMRQNQGEGVNSDACVSETVQYQEQYFAVNHWRTIVWQNPPTLASVAVFLGGVAVVLSLVRKQIDATP
ncbi:hypothetical protein [Halorussus halophilus]|uniref:hypothetical protein n=1 Tax=Halorussus halophilus TaxID=2650975 RepID=UPI0013013ECE|nr:hypothetical protein [Halorussus halophilus]